MRLATFNVENLFARAKALGVSSAGEDNALLTAYERFDRVSSKLQYDETDKAQMLADLETLEVLKRSQAGNLRFNTRPFDAWALLRENRGDFIKQPGSGSVEIIAEGRNAWIGWVDLIVESVDAIGIHMTARVIDDVAADVLAVVEAEDRPSLVRFNDELLNGRYGHVMLIDGNDERGIDVGLLTADHIAIRAVTSHVDIPDPDRPGESLFSRDCPAYRLDVAGTQLWVLVNHLKSQSFTFGNPAPLRTRQANQVRQIYDQLRADGIELIAVVGDLNKGPTNTTPPQHPTPRAGRRIHHRRDDR